MSLIVICPTRGRPARANEAFEAFVATKSLPSTAMYFIVDDDDPTKPAYDALGLPVLSYGPSGDGMAKPVNAAAAALATKCDIIAFVGDDHRFRTPSWDVIIGNALAARPGFAYGDDGIRSDIPSQVFITSGIVQALGWMCLPGAKHLYLDNTWAELGRRADCLTYLPNVVVEHMHPVVGKGQVDEGYARVNDPAVYSHDGQLFVKWIESGQVDIDVETVKEAIR